MNATGEHPTDTQAALEGERLFRRLLHALADDETIDETSPEKLEEIWTQRALLLARVPEEEQQGEQIEVLLVRLGREVLGIEVSCVVEIRQDEPVTRVPRVPAWVVGVTNLRGRILSVVDLRLYLGLPEAPARKETGSEQKASYLVEVESPEMELVFQVDEVLGVETPPAGDIRIESGLIHTLPPEYLRGVVNQKQNPYQDEFVTVSILNLNALLTDPRLIINDYAGSDDGNG